MKDAGFDINNAEIPPLNLHLSEEELLHGKNVLKNLNANEKATICIFTFATGAKCYPKEWWMPVYERLKNYKDDYNIIELLPKENVSQIDFDAPTYYSTDIREMAAVMANCAVVIAADSGIMHLASSAGVPTVGLFSITYPDIYRPYNKGSIAVDTNKTTIDEMMQSIDNILIDSRIKLWQYDTQNLA